MEESFQYHSEVLRGDFALYRAIRAIALRAWDAREAKLRQQGLYFKVPQFITQARERAGIKPQDEIGTAGPQQVPMQGVMGSGSFQPYGMPISASRAIVSESMAASEPSLAYSVGWPPPPPGISGEDGLFLQKPGEPSPIDWDAWDSLVQMDLPTLEFGLEAFFK
jgi:hypothetical protein